jgi:hypothetical protein
MSDGSHAQRIAAQLRMDDKHDDQKPSGDGVDVDAPALDTWRDADSAARITPDGVEERGGSE